MIVILASLLHKQDRMKIKNYLLIGLIGTGFIFTQCSDDDVPPEENEEEVINEVTLTFTPIGGGTPVIATWIDADGEGTADPVLTEIDLATATSYSLAITFENTLESPAEDITEEVEKEGEEHQIFFSWSDAAFGDPAGEGNIGASGTVNYDDEDNSGNPIGLETSWTTSANPVSDQSFRILLKHQPDIKTATSTSNDGETDIDITWTLNVN